MTTQTPSTPSLMQRVQLALDYSRNFANAKPDIGGTEKEHILGLCKLLEEVTRPAPRTEAGREWVLVPREPTPEMLEAAGTIDGYDSDRETADADHIAWWNDMLSAAPLVPPGSTLTPAEVSNCAPADSSVDSSSTRTTGEGEPVIYGDPPDTFDGPVEAKPLSAEDCARWLDKKYARHHEVEDKAAAAWLRYLAAAPAVSAEPVAWRLDYWWGDNDEFTQHRIFDTLREVKTCETFSLGSHRRTITPLFPHPASEPAVPAEVGEAFEAGWCAAAQWAKRSDLLHDVGSQAYERDKQAFLARRAQGGSK